MHMREKRRGGGKTSIATESPPITPHEQLCRHLTCRMTRWSVDFSHCNMSHAPLVWQGDDDVSTRA
jgi:hypothetical protein